MARSKSYAEITMKSGAVITFDCVSLSWKRRSSIGETLTWELPDGASRRLVRIDLDEIAAAVFVDGTAA